jgi:hypothetical protein
MRTIRLIRQEHIAIMNVSLISMFLLFSMTVKAQIPINFSGKWEFDKAKSSPDLLDSNFDGIVTRQITQTASTIAYHDIYVKKGSNDWATLDEIFNLDGKEQVKKDNSGTLKKSAKWSQDTNVLTLIILLTYTEEGVSKETQISESYKLSDEGKTLTIESYSKDQVTGETKKKAVYHKK